MMQNGAALYHAFNSFSSQSKINIAWGREQDSRNSNNFPKLLEEVDYDFKNVT